MAQIETKMVPLRDDGRGLEELNRFLRSHRVVQIDRRMVSDPYPAWAFCIEYLEGAGGSERRGKRIDYREVLSSEQFELFSKLREVRKQLSEQEGVPLYAIFTNEQLAAVVRGGVAEVADLHKIEGVGEAKAAKYGEAIVAALNGGPKTDSRS